MDKGINFIDDKYHQIKNSKFVSKLSNIVNKIKEYKRKIQENKYYKKISVPLKYICKILSSAVIVLLVLIGAFLIYYVVSCKVAEKNGEYCPKISLYTIVSGSMEPAIKVYDVVMTIGVENPEEIQVGDVITFYSTSSISEGLIVTHRVVEVKVVNGEYQYVTKGDYNATADSNTASFSNIIGKVALKIPQLGRIQFFVASKLGWFLVVLLPAMGVIIYDVIKLLRLLVAKEDSEKVAPGKKITSTGDTGLDEVVEAVKKNDYINRLNEMQANTMSLPKLNPEFENIKEDVSTLEDVKDEQVIEDVKEDAFEKQEEVKESVIEESKEDAFEKQEEVKESIMEDVASEDAKENANLVQKEDTSKELINHDNSDKIREKLLSKLNK